MKILYWLRNDLRLHDNEALAALPAHAEALLPVFCFDPATLGPDRYLGLPRLGPHRLPFLLETLAELQHRYVTLGSGIHFVVGNPATELPRLVQELGLSTVWASAEHPHEETTAETDLAAALGRTVPLRFFETLSLLHPHDLPYSPCAAAALVQ
jgi:deoxyribodipyrimidine photo-lyase